MPFLILCTRLFFDEYLKIVRVFSLLCSAPFSVLAFFSLSFSFDFYVQDLPFCLPILCFYSLVLCACILLYLLQSPLSFSWYPLFFSLPFPSIFFAFLPFSPVFFFSFTLFLFPPPSSFFTLPSFLFALFRGWRCCSVTGVFVGYMSPGAPVDRWTQLLLGLLLLRPSLVPSSSALMPDHCP